MNRARLHIILCWVNPFFGVSPKHDTDRRGEGCPGVRVRSRLRLVHLAACSDDLFCVAARLQLVSGVQDHLQKNEVFGMDRRLPVVQGERELPLPPPVQEYREQQIAQIAAPEAEHFSTRSVVWNMLEKVHWGGVSWPWGRKARARV